jgi:hypothetical protein
VVYSQNVMSEGTLKQWCRIFKDGQTNVHDEEQSKPIVCDDIVQNVDQKICEGWLFTISEISLEYPQILCAVLFKIIIVKVGYHKSCAR